MVSMMEAEIIRQYQKDYVLQSWSKQADLNPLVIEKGEGIYFYDSDGNRYSDMSSQLVNMNLGFGNQDIEEAIKAQADKFCFVGPSFAAEPRSLLAKMIIDRLPASFADSAGSGRAGQRDRGGPEHMTDFTFCAFGAGRFPYG